MTRREAITFQAAEEIRKAKGWLRSLEATSGVKRSAITDARKEVHAANMRAQRLIDNLRANHRLPPALEAQVRHLMKR